MFSRKPRAKLAKRGNGGTAAAGPLSGGILVVDHPARRRNSHPLNTHRYQLVGKTTHWTSDFDGTFPAPNTTSPTVQSPRPSSSAALVSDNSAPTRPARRVTHVRVGPASPSRQGRVHLGLREVCGRAQHLDSRERLAPEVFQRGTATCRDVAEGRLVEPEQPHGRHGVTTTHDRQSVDLRQRLGHRRPLRTGGTARCRTPTPACDAPPRIRVDAEVLPWQVGGIALGQRDDRGAPAVDGVPVAVVGVEPARGRVVGEQGSQPGVVGQVVDGGDVDVGARSTYGAKEGAADAKSLMPTRTVTSDPPGLGW
jgi:hypothetical protein